MLTAVALGTALGGGPIFEQGLARAQATEAGALPEDALPLSDLADDPIAIDSASRALDDVPREHSQTAAEQEDARLRYGPLPPTLGARGGEVLNANPSVRETQHRVDVTLGAGLATVEVLLSFDNLSARPAELEYRLAVPRGAGLAELQVCNGRGCRDGRPEATTGDALSAYDASVLARGASEPLPVARGRLISDARGQALWLRAAPVSKAQPLTLRVRYLAPTAQYAGRLVMALPARGMDPRVAPAEVHVEAGGLADARVNGSPTGAPGASVKPSAASGPGSAPHAPAGVHVDPWSTATIEARDRHAGALRHEAIRYRCDATDAQRQGARGRTAARDCVRVQVSAGPLPPVPRDLVIALDVSPSTEGPARGRLVSAVADVLALAPAGTRVRALAFAGRAQVLMADPRDPADVPLQPFAQAVAHAELGSATRFSAVWAVARQWLGGRPGARARGTPAPLIVLLGDGGLTLGEDRAFAQARAAGVEVAVVNMGERATRDGLLKRVHESGGVALSPGLVADTLGPIEARAALEALFAPTVQRAVTVRGVRGGQVALGPLRAGASLHWSGTAAGPASLQYGRTRVAARAATAERARALNDTQLLEAGAPSVPLVAVDTRDIARDMDDWPTTRAGSRGCDRRGPARRHGGVSNDAAPVSLARERVCMAPAKSAVSSGGEMGLGMPSEPLLQMLRQRIMPVARGCFRRDRAGRPDYDRRAVFAFTLAEREVVSAHVEGSIGANLRLCLLQAVDGLDVPRFSGTVNVRYPLVTQSVEAPVTIELTRATGGDVDALFGSEPKP